MTYKMISRVTFVFASLIGAPGISHAQDFLWQGWRHCEHEGGGRELCWKPDNSGQAYNVDRATVDAWMQAKAAAGAQQQATHEADLKSGRVAPNGVRECLIAKGIKGGEGEYDVLLKPDNSVRTLVGDLMSFEGSEGLLVSTSDASVGASFEVDANTYWPTKDKTVLRAALAVGGRYVSNSEATTALGQKIPIIHLQAICIMQQF